MDVVTYLKNHTEEHAEDSASDSDGKSDLDEDYFKYLPPPISEETILNNVIPCTTLNRDCSSKTPTSYSDILKIGNGIKTLEPKRVLLKPKKKKNKVKSPESTKLIEIPQNSNEKSIEKVDSKIIPESLDENNVISTTKQSNNEIPKAILDKPENPKENLMVLDKISNVTVDKKEKLNENVTLLQIEPEKLSELIRKEVKKQFEQLKQEYEFVPKKTAPQNSDKNGIWFADNRVPVLNGQSVKNQSKTKSVNNATPKKVSSSGEKEISVNLNTINKIFSYVNNIEQCAKVMFKEKLISNREMHDDCGRRLQHILKNVEYAQTAIKKLKEC